MLTHNQPTMAAEKVFGVRSEKIARPRWIRPTLSAPVAHCRNRTASPPFGVNLGGESPLIAGCRSPHARRVAVRGYRRRFMGWSRRILVTAGLATVAAGATLGLGRSLRTDAGPATCSTRTATRSRPPSTSSAAGSRAGGGSAERHRGGPQGALGGQRRGGDRSRHGRARAAGFYRRRFGNEVFLTDVMGMLDGGLTPTQVALAVAKLGGRAPPTSRSPWPARRPHRRADLPYGRAGPDRSRRAEGRAFIIGIKTFSDRGTCAWASPAPCATPRSIPGPARSWRGRPTPISMPGC